MARSRPAHLANIFAEQDVRWFEEPVSSDDLEGLRFVRDHAPPHGYRRRRVWLHLDYFRRMLEAGAVDVLQADATRCGGVTGSCRRPISAKLIMSILSAHCAPALHRHLGCAAPRFRHVEWFHDHVRIEQMFFDGAPVPHRARSRPTFASGTGPDVEAPGRRALCGGGGK